MPQKSTPTKKNLKTTKNKPVARVASTSRTTNLFNRRFALIIVVILVAIGGTYLLRQSSAATDDRLVDDPGRGLSYRGLKIAHEGPCAGVFESDVPSDAEHGKSCTHPDPVPGNVDIRERDKNVEAMIAQQVEYDIKNPAKNAGEPTPPPVLYPENSPVYNGNSLGAVSPINWPCVGTGNDGFRTLTIYAYPSGATNRLGSLRPFFEGVARRVNAVYYNSGAASGGVRQIRYQTNSSCVLSIPYVAITGDINSLSNIMSQLRAIGYSSTARKYMVWVDGGTGCGQGELKPDLRPGQENYNNAGNMISVNWHGCWNGSEPHELTHNMGAVQNGAPYSTNKGHCYDQNDVMCYKDTSGINTQQLCTSTTNVYRLDCRNDTYFRSTGATGWLGTNWNVANNQFLVR